MKKKNIQFLLSQLVDPGRDNGLALSLSGFGVLRSGVLGGKFWRVS
jgi:hypothetical protein